MKSGGLLLLVLLAVLAGCRTLPPAPPVAPGLTADQILSRLEARQEGLSSFALRGRLVLLSPRQNATGTALIKGKLPETLRVDLKDPLGRSVLNFATDGRVVELLFPRENKLLRGPATPTNLAAFIPPGVSLPQTLRLLVADLPLSEGPPARMRYEPGEGMYVLEWLQGDGSLRERLWVQAQGILPRKEEWYGTGGRLAFKAELDEFDRQAAPRPRRLKLISPGPKVELRLTYKDFTPNPSLTPAALAVPRPPGVRILPLKP